MSEQNDGWGGQAARFGKAVIDQAIMPALEKLIPQGASELGNALYTGNAYVPYGPTNRPVSMESSDLYGQASEQPGSYEAELAKYVTLDPQQAQQQRVEASGLYGPTTTPETTQAPDYETELARYVSRAQEPQQTKEMER